MFAGKGGAIFGNFTIKEIGIPTAPSRSAHVQLMHMLALPGYRCVLSSAMSCTRVYRRTTNRIQTLCIYVIFSYSSLLLMLLSFYEQRTMVFCHQNFCPFIHVYHTHNIYSMYQWSYCFYYDNFEGPPSPFFKFPQNITFQ